MVENRVVVTNSVSEGRRTWVLQSLEGGVCNPNPDAIEGRNPYSARVPYLEYYYPKYSHDLRFNWDEQILIKQDKALPRGQGAWN
jgi:hypothetical protein